MFNSWETEEEQDGRDSKVETDITRHAGDNTRVLSYETKAHVVLEDSKKETWGIAKFIEGPFHDTDRGVVVGTWSKSPVDNNYHIFLESPIRALQDKATQHHLELVKKREAGETGIPVPGAASRRKPGKQPEPRSEIAEEAMTEIERIRASLKQ